MPRAPVRSPRSVTSLPNATPDAFLGSAASSAVARVDDLLRQGREGRSAWSPSKAPPRFYAPISQQGGMTALNGTLLSRAERMAVSVTSWSTGWIVRWSLRHYRQPRRRPVVLRNFAAAALSFLLLSVFALTARAASTETWEAPVGGSPLSLGDARVACPGTTGSWSIDQGGHSLGPPTSARDLGTFVDAKIAPSLSACATTTSTLTLVVTGPFPEIDEAATTLFVDEGRLDLGGRGLRGAQVEWQAGTRSGVDRCVQPQADSTGEHCAIAVGHGLSADPVRPDLHVSPVGARPGPDVVLFDSTGRRMTIDDRTIHPGRIVVSSLVAPDVAIDLAGGTASRIPLVHPEAVVGADCGAVSCAVSDGGIVVGGLTTVTTTLAVRLRLAPRVVLRKGEGFDAAPVISVSVLPCAMSIASGEQLRGVDASRAVVRVDARCGAEARDLRWFSAGRLLDVLGMVESSGATYMLLAVGRVEGDELVVTAVRSAGDGSTVGQARVRTRAAPLPRATLTLDDERIDFVPTNRPATARWARAQGAGELALLPVDGAYDLFAHDGSTQIQAERGSGGFVALRFAWRVPTLPEPFGAVDLAVIVDPVQRPMHEATVAVPLVASEGKPPLVDVLCGGGGDLQQVPPGKSAHVPFADRDACRIVFHGDRLSRADGAQHLQLDVDVTGADGATRPEARVTQFVVLRPGSEPRIVWIKGAVRPFDRATIRISYQADTQAQVGGQAEPSAQFAIVFGTAHFRLYATTAIPTGLYRVSDRQHSGILSLNLAVIMRGTWLDRAGHEGVVGLEGGVLAEGLANDVDTSGHSLTQVATVIGMGLSVPIANRSLATETSINLHAWFEYEISRAIARDLGKETGSPLGFVFGPSLSIGNIGTNL